MATGPEAGGVSEPGLRLSYIYDFNLPFARSAPVQILNTCRALAELGVPTTLLIRNVLGKRQDIYDFYGLEPHPCFEIRPLFSTWRWRLRPSWALRSILSVGENPSPHVVMSRGETGLDIAPFLAGLRRRGTLFVYESHRLSFSHHIEQDTGTVWDGQVPPPGPYLDTYAREKAVVEGADGLVCLTEGVQDALTQFFAISQPVLILPSGTAVGGEHSAPTRSQRVDVVYAGKLSDRKGLPVLIEAMRYLPDRTLRIVGGDSHEVTKLREMVRGDEVESRIEFTGYVEPSRVRDHLQQARVGVCPLPEGISTTSEKFTSSLKILELMAAGTPVVASNLPSVRSMVTHGETAWLVAPSDPRALADGVRTLIEDEPLSARLARQARTRVQSFSWDNRAARLKSFLADLIEERRNARGARGKAHG